MASSSFYANTKERGGVDGATTKLVTFTGDGVKAPCMCKTGNAIVDLAGVRTLEGVCKSGYM